MRPIARDRLRTKIIRSLRTQGFSVRKGRLIEFADTNKGSLRALHQSAVSHRIADAHQRLICLEPRFLRSIANGSEVDPLNIRPRLVQVVRGSFEELLFRYVTLHWSIPVSSGYGRRLRFLVLDESNEKLIGVIGLADPVINLKARDAFIGWNTAQKANRLRYVMDAFVLGAVPPYTFLLGGKLVAMLAASEQVRAAFRRQYRQSTSRISEQTCDGRLAMLTTTSALGRSSVYNRLSYRDGPLFLHAGLTAGSGEFHFSNGVYSSMAAYAARYCEPTGKHSSWGGGFRNRREVVKKCLQRIGLSSEWVYHGVRREVFAVPLATNTLPFLRGETDRLRYLPLDAGHLFDYFRERWLLPRSDRDRRFLEWSASDWRLW